MSSQTNQPDDARYPRYQETQTTPAPVSEAVPSDTENEGAMCANCDHAAHRGACGAKVAGYGEPCPCESTLVRKSQSSRIAATPTEPSDGLTPTQAVAWALNPNRRPANTGAPPHPNASPEFLRTLAAWCSRFGTGIAHAAPPVLTAIADEMEARNADR